MNVTKEQWLQIAKVVVTALLVIAGILGYDLGIVLPRTEAYVAAAVHGQAETAESRAASALPRLVSVNTTGITQTQYLGSAFEWYRGSTPFTWADIYYSIDQGTTNTVTLSLEVSPDGTNYVSFVPKADPGLTDASANIVASNAADASGYVSAEIAMRFFKVKATVTNSELVTPTVKVWLR